MKSGRESEYSSAFFRTNSIQCDHSGVCEGGFCNPGRGCAEKSDRADTTSAIVSAIRWKYWGGIWKHPDGLSALTADNGSTCSSISVRATSNTSKTVRSVASPSSFGSRSRTEKFRRSWRIRRTEDRRCTARQEHRPPGSFHSSSGEANERSIVLPFRFAMLPESVSNEEWTE